MLTRMSRGTLVIIVLVAGLAFSGHDVLADHESFFLKFPWQDGVSRGISQGFNSGTHVGSEKYALDFLTPTSDSIRAAHEGGVVQIVTSPDCDPTKPPGVFPNVEFGNTVVLQGTTPSEADWWTRYAHLSAISISLGVFLFQGDPIGNPGDTGFTIDDNKEPPLNACGVHLHFATYNAFPCETETCAQDPGEIDGEACCNPESSNAIIGDTNIHPDAGQAMRVEYSIQGEWEDVGRVYEVETRTLPMHAYGSGWEQTFKNHAPDSISGIYVRNAQPTVSAYVKPDFWTVWQGLGGASSTLGLPLTSELGVCPLYAPPGCQRLQEFECGYIWSDGQDIEAVTCGRGLLVYTTTPAYYRAKFTGGVWEETGDGPGAGRLSRRVALS